MKPVIRERESDLVATIVEGLRLQGYLCHRCNQARADKSGSDVLPDLFVRRDGWPAACWLGLEVKTAAGRVGLIRRGKAALSQRDLLNRGAIAVVRSWEDAWATVQDFEGRLR